MDRFRESIDKQIEFNQGKNIFTDDIELFQFVRETVNAISGIDKINRSSEQLLIEYATDKALEEFCRVNQYYSFDSGSKEKLKNLYSCLFEDIRTRSSSVEDISKSHFERLKKWLKESNPFSERLYTHAGSEINPVPCSEYSPELQIGILHIDIQQLAEPVLDIGCGSHGILVGYLTRLGIEAYGIDRIDSTSSDLIAADWLEYDYGEKRWGTIISNMAFSNHFIHHNLREDGNYIEYGKTYMNILHSLKTGGCFHYAPDLPFIEMYLDNRGFALRRYEIEGYDFRTTIIKRLK